MMMLVKVMRSVLVRVCRLLVVRGDPNRVPDARRAVNGGVTALHSAIGLSFGDRVHVRSKSRNVVVDIETLGVELVVLASMMSLSVVLKLMPMRCMAGVASLRVRVLPFSTRLCFC